MKLYAYTTPDIPKNAGYLKIGETHGDVEKRVQQQIHEQNIEKHIVWQDAVITERSGIDKILHRYLKEQGFHVQQFTESGKDTELVKCTVGDIEKAFAVIKEQLYQDELKRQALGDKFYREIRNWYYWTTETNKKIDSDYALRLVVRLLFCYFLKEKGIVPEDLFKENFVKEHLEENKEYRYYNAILRNLFFHCLNTPITERNDIEYEKLIKNTKRVKEQFAKIPFLNGGLFNEHRGDDVPLNDDYFFSEKRTRHLSELELDDQVAGIIRILSQYQYKLTLDNLLDRDEYVETVDPEFIGKVFESLLACIDADSRETRRKITGSYYTPREIVDYMVCEALDCFQSHHQSRNRKVATTRPLSPLGERDRVRGTESSGETTSPLPNPLPEGEGTMLLQCKILDPACGSGAFPCSIMNEIMRRIDPPALDRYHTRLKIIQNVIYGADIQPMAVQITSLRFFLSLIQDIIPDKRKPNYGIDPLPNLEMKFVCADTLVGLKNGKNGQGTLELPRVKEAIKELQKTRCQYFMANNICHKESLRQMDESWRKILAIAMEDAGALTHGTAEKLVAWNPYEPSHSASFFDPVWMFGVESFDIVIGNPPYVESRSTNVSAKLKATYQDQVKSDFGDLSQYITKGSDLLIYFFPRSITLLSERGIGMLIVQNGWLNTDYGAKASQFLVKTLQHVKIVDSPFRHFNRASANVNTVIVRFKKQSDVKKIEFDLMKKEGEIIVTQKGKSFDMGDRILSGMKWGMVMSTDTDILSVLTSIIEKGKNIDQSFYTVGQGINVSQNSFIPKNEKSKFQQKTNIINAVFKEYQYSYTRFAYFLYHSFKPSPSDISILESINAEEFGNGQRKYPSIIMPRGIGAVHFAGLLNGKALSNSFVDVYVDTQDEEKKLNIWLFCNSSLFFLYRELSGRKNLGGGLLKSEAADIKLFPLYFPIADKDTILAVASEMGEPINLQDRLKISVQKKLDELVFAYFEIKSDGQTKVINELLRQFHFRCDKAKN